MAGERYEASVLDFENRDEDIYVRQRVGVCQEPEGSGICGLPLMGLERRRGTSVIVEGSCPKGHSFSRAGYAQSSLEEEFGNKKAPASPLDLERLGWVGVSA